MIGFLVRTATRTAVRAAINGQRESRARAAALQSQMRAFPFAMTPKAHDVALYTDLRNGFGHLVPGRPQLTPAMPSPGEPPDDTALWLSDLPITVRYRLEGPAFAATSAADLAGRTAEEHARRRARTGTSPGVELVHPGWLGAWATEAAARASYDLAYVDPMGADREDLFILVRSGSVMRVTVRYPNAAVDVVTRSLFLSAFEATLSFHPERWHQVHALWPESSFLEPRVIPTLRPAREEQVRGLTPMLRVGEAERTSIFRALDEALKNAGAPWLALDAASWNRHRDALLGPVADPRLRAAIEAGFGEVRTAHDLRGLALVAGRAVELAHRPSSMAPPPHWHGPSTIG